MASVGRNEPCLCGGGKKYKRCCGDPAAANGVARPDKIHEIDRALVANMVEWAARRFDRGWHPFAEFPVDFDERDMGPLAELLAPWSVYECRYRDEEGRELTIAEMFRAARPRSLSEEERAWLSAQTRASMSIWEIEGVEPGVGLSMHDLLTGERRFVAEVGLTRSILPRHAMLTRVVETPSGAFVFCGTYLAPLPPVSVAEAVTRSRAALRVKSGPITRELLREPESSDAVITAWHEVVLAQAGGRMPALRNTEGDPLLFTVDRFAVTDSAKKEVMRRLSLLPGAHVDAHDDDEPSVVFHRGGDPLKAIPGTVVGVARVYASGLRLETNSLRRADELRALVEDSCGELLQHTLRDHTDPKVLLHEARARAGHEQTSAVEQLPEATAMIREVKARHYAEWVDLPVPALGGKTPREATRRKADRAKVDVLLKDLEHRESQAPEAERFDMSQLRSILGL